MTVPLPSAFVAVDWSGARGVRHRGIAIALARQGSAPPALVPPPHPGGWSRLEVADWLGGLPMPVLAGFDFSFAPPFVDCGAYFPGLAAPVRAPDLWAWLDAHAQDPDLGATSLVHGILRGHMWLGAADGPKAGFLRWRQCERAFNASGGGKAATLFDCVGAAQVAKASLAGMRLLHRLRGVAAIWPFEAPAAGRHLAVEIYTRAMLRHTGGRGTKVRDAQALGTALAALGTRPPPPARLTDHETDVLVAAAALRHLAGRKALWAPAGLTPAVAATEGWTFGVV